MGLIMQLNEVNCMACRIRQNRKLPSFNKITTEAL